MNVAGVRYKLNHIKFAVNKYKNRNLSNPAWESQKLIKVIDGGNPNLAKSVAENTILPYYVKAAKLYIEAKTMVDNSIYMSVYRMKKNNTISPLFNQSIAVKYYKNLNEAFGYFFSNNCLLPKMKGKKFSLLQKK